VAEGFWRIAADDPGRVAVVEAAGDAVTFGELAARANRVTHGLRRLGLTTGDVVAAVLPNGITTIELYLAALQGGWYLVPVGTRLTGPEIGYILADSGARVLVCSERHAEACIGALAGLDSPPPAYVVADPANPDTHDAHQEAPGSFRPYADLTAGTPAERPGDRISGATMHYTSGTTGRPKGVRRPLGGLDPDEQAQRLSMFLLTFGILPHGGGVHLAVAPLYHTAVMTFTSSSLHAGHTVVLMDGWSAETTLRLIAEHRVTTSHMVPTHFHRLLALPDDVRAAADVSSLAHVIHAAAPCPIDTKRRMLDWWGPVIYEYYAATEGGGTVVTPSEWLERPGTVGRAWPNAEIRVQDERGRTCPPGEPGVVWMSLNIDFEYHRDPAKTRDGRRDGFFTVGDVGYLDEAGYLFLCDRASDMIISGGVNVYPAEVEAALFGHPKVADVAVFGVPDAEWGEQVKAVVEPAAGAVAGPELEAELIAFCRERLAAYKCPRSVDLIEAMPREPTGKLLKRKLRDPYWETERRAI
jgi:long-chain acyl-CoA synthetase